MRFDVSRVGCRVSIKGFNEGRAGKPKSASSLQRAMRAGTKAKEETFSCIPSHSSLEHPRPDIGWSGAR
jgi:hypothetical protein